MEESAYRNATEFLVEQRVDRLMKLMGCCTCSRCRTDVICIALNHLPHHYVSTQAGMLFSKLRALDQQMAADITIQITTAAQYVKNHPHHALAAPAAGTVPDAGSSPAADTAAQSDVDTPAPV